MKLINTNSIRRSAISIATAIAIAAPGLASAGMLDRAKSGIQTVKTRTGIVITNVQQHRPLANQVDTVKAQAGEIFDQVKQLKVVEQLKQTMGLVQQMQADYEYFSGGEGCAATCAAFRSSLKNTFNSFALLVSDLPALNSESGLVENMQRVSNLIDYLPPRALYLLWQAMSGKMAELETASDGIRQTLAQLPPLLPVTGFGAGSADMSTMSVGSTARGRASDLVSNASDSYCDWKDKEDDPWVKMVRARLDLFGWRIEQLEGLIPDVEVKGEGGGNAGIGVANASANAGVGVKATDGVKLTLKLIAYLPQRISKSIEMNILQANALCR